MVSAGELADTLYYRSVRMPDDKLAVGYSAFFSEERPWGINWLTWTFLPALVVEMVYSRALLVAPGPQRAIYGKGDVEGARIYYDVAADGSLSVDHAVADDGTHGDVVLSRADLFAVDPARPVLYSEVWSHQLGGKGRTLEERSRLRALLQGRAHSPAIGRGRARVQRRRRGQGTSPASTRRGDG